MSAHDTPSEQSTDVTEVQGTANPTPVAPTFLRAWQRTYLVFAPLALTGIIMLAADGADSAAFWLFVLLALPGVLILAGRMSVRAWRRACVLSLAAALVLTMLMAAVVFRPTYTAEAFFRVASEQQTLVFRTAEAGSRSERAEAVGRSRFEIYKATQQQLITSPFVITAALRQPGINELRCIRQQDDPVVWLRRKIKVSFPGGAEIMRVSLKGKDPKEAATLVQAVIDAYQDEVVYIERADRKKHLSELDVVYAEKEDQVRARRTEFKQLAERLGTGEGPTFALKQENALQQFRAYRDELLRHQLALRRANGERHAKKALLETLDKEEISENELGEFAQKDPIARQMLTELISRRSKYDAMIGAPDATSADTEQVQRELKVAQQQFDKRKEELREDLRRKKIVMFEQGLKRLEIEIAIAEQQVILLQEDVDRQRKIVEKFGESSVDLEMMRAEIRSMEEVLHAIRLERNKLRVELRSASRITLIQQAEVPKGPDTASKPTSDEPPPTSEEPPAAPR